MNDSNESVIQPHGEWVCCLCGAHNMQWDWKDFFNHPLVLIRNCRFEMKCDHCGESHWFAVSNENGRKQ